MYSLPEINKVDIPLRLSCGFSWFNLSLYDLQLDILKTILVKNVIIYEEFGTFFLELIAEEPILSSLMMSFDKLNLFNKMPMEETLFILQGEQ